MIFRAHMNILINTKVKILALIKWSYRSSLSYVDYRAYNNGYHILGTQFTCHSKIGVLLKKTNQIRHI